MAHTAALGLPVYIRLGDQAEHQVGTLFVGEGDWALSQQSLVGLLRAVADEMDQTSAGGFG